MKQNTLIAIVAVVSLIIGVFMALFIAPPADSSPKYLQQYPAPRALTDFSLTDQHGETFNKEDLQGKWTLAFVGYTYCPDICPTTLAELQRIYPQLQQIATDAPIQVLFLSVDPARDTTERLKQYTDFFHPDFIAASGEHSQLFALVRSMGMMYSMSDDTSNPNYLVDHSSSITLINPEANVIGRFKPHMEPGKLAVSDGEQILADLPLIVRQQS